MKPFSRPSGSIPVYWFLLFAVLFSLQVIPRLTGDSPVGDEMGDIVNGYYYWDGDLLSDARHPPLPKCLQALPLRFLGLQSKAHAQFNNTERRAYNFIFVLNRDRFETVVAWARAVTLAFGLGIGFLLYWTARNESRLFLCLALSLWAFEPNLLAFSGLAFADIPVTFFFLAAVLCFKGLRQKKEWGWSFAVGALTGMAITSKFSAAILAPVFLLMEFWEGWPRDPKERWPFLEELAGRWAVGLAGAAAWIFLLYSPGMFAIPGHRSPFLYFWDGFWGIASLSGYSTYFLGHLTRTNHLFYFPLALLVKTPPALLVFTLISPFLLAFKRIKIPLELWLPPLAFFFSVMPFANIGIREILPVFPFLILLAARSADSVFRWGTHRFISRAAVIGLVALQVIIVSLEFPKHLSYFNPLLNSNQKLYLLGDSNLDVGQDGKRLAAAAALHNWHHVKLAYFGATDPSVYGMDWSYWTENDLKGPQPGWVYAINAYYLQIGPAFMPDARNVLDSWIAHTPETTKVGDTWYCYEIPGQPAPDSSPFLPSAPPFKYFESLGRETSPVKTQ